MIRAAASQSTALPRAGAVSRSSRGSARATRIPPMASPRRRRRFLVPALLATALVLGAGTGLTLEATLPSVESLREWRPSTVTTIRAADGSVLSRIGEEKRIVIEFGKIPNWFIQAIVATEDSHFYGHIGIDPLGIARAALSNITSGRWRSQGGSTITQQLARNLFLNPDKTVKRKVQEAILAVQLERGYTKQEILTYYANQVYLGHGRYGIEAAAEFYFSKPAKDLSLAQCALLAGVVQAPDRLSPIRHADQALKRRAHVLSRMVEEGYVSAHDAELARNEPLELTASSEGKLVAPYFVEEVRRYLRNDARSRGPEGSRGSGARRRARAGPQARVPEALEKRRGEGTSHRVPGPCLGGAARSRTDRPGPGPRLGNNERRAARRRVARNPEACGRGVVGPARHDGCHEAGGSRSSARHAAPRFSEPARGRGHAMAGGRSGARRDRLRDGGGARPGRRIRLRAQRVRPCGAGPPPGRLRLQAISLLRRDRLRTSPRTTTGTTQGERRCARPSKNPATSSPCSCSIRSATNL